MTSGTRTVLAALCIWLAIPTTGILAEIRPDTGRKLIPSSVYKSMQNWMLDKRFDGWLFTGQGTFNDVEGEFLGLRGKTKHRWFIFYGALASLREPFLIYHRDDEHVFDGVSFYPTTYRNYVEMKQELEYRIFSVSRDIAINYSPKLKIPEVSQIDIGTVELLQELGLRLRPSCSMLSFYNTRWTNEEVESHKYAAARLDSILPIAVKRIGDRLSRDKKITDYDLARHIGKNLGKLDLELVDPVVVAVGENTLKEKFIPTKKNQIRIERDDLIYLEVTARRKKQPEAMHARLGWTLVASDTVSSAIQASWNRITAAADTALALISNRIKSNITLTGQEVDIAARRKLSGNPHVLPRALGYNLNRNDRNFGVRFDNYLYLDNREVMPGMGFTLEPGLYSEQSALKLCTNLFIEGDREVTLSAPLQRKLIAVMGNPALVAEAFMPPLD
jgi:Xaa-Pro dipeptidase